MAYNETYFVLWGLRPFWSSDLKQSNDSGGFRGGALGASAPPAESMVKIS